jgi:hypothetical protein
VTEQVPQPEHNRELAAELRLRPERPPVTRLSRRILIGLGAFAAVVISGALIWGLYQGQRKTTAGNELYNTDNKPTPDGLATLPRDYTGLPRNSPPPTGSGVPVLGPPLPGDLGRPIRNAQLAISAPGEPATRSSSASRRKPKPRAPAVCSRRPTRGSAQQRQLLCRRRQPPTKPRRHKLDEPKHHHSTPTQSSTCRTESSRS